MSEPDRVVRLVELREGPLQADEVLAAVADAAAGGVALFVGAVRDHDEHKAVVGLGYSAHPTALSQMQAVSDKVASEYDVLAVAALHRTGRLDIGDAAVIVAAAAAQLGYHLRG